MADLLNWDHTPCDTQHMEVVAYSGMEEMTKKHPTELFKSNKTRHTDAFGHHSSNSKARHANHQSDEENIYHDLLMKFMFAGSTQKTSLANLWIFGTMSSLNTWTQRYFALDFLFSSLRSVGQVVFANNPLSGLLIVIAMFIQSVPVAFYGVVGVLIANGSAIALRLEHGLFNSGLFGFNAYLVGLCLATFHKPDLWQDGRLFFPVALFAIFSVVLFVALGKFLVPQMVPPFTLPFNLAALIYLSGTTSYANFNTSLSPQLVLNVEVPVAEIDWEQLCEASIKGVGQIFLADNTASGFMVIVGIFVCSPIAAFAAVCGSFTGNLTAVAMGADLTQVYLGLWGYNGSLCCIAICGMFYILSVRTFLLSLLCAVMGTVAMPSMATILSPMGTPAMTFPFCIAVLPFVLLQGAASGMPAVPLDRMTVPEDHLLRQRMTKQVVRSLRRALGDAKCYLPDMPILKSEEEQLHRMFQYVAQDQKCVVEVQQLASIINSLFGEGPQGELIFEAADCEVLRVMDFDKFSEFMAYKRLLWQQKQELHKYFQLVGTEDSNAISVEELNRAMTSLGEGALTVQEIAKVFSLCGVDDGDIETKINSAQLADLIFKWWDQQLSPIKAYATPELAGACQKLESL